MVEDRTSPRQSTAGDRGRRAADQACRDTPQRHAPSAPSSTRTVTSATLVWRGTCVHTSCGHERASHLAPWRHDLPWKGKQLTSADRTPDRHPAQWLALIIGVTYTIVGLVGFALTGFSGFAAPEGELLLGVFEINPLHNVVHLVIGLAGVALWKPPPPCAAVWLAARRRLRAHVHLRPVRRRQQRAGELSGPQPGRQLAAHREHAGRTGDRPLARTGDSADPRAPRAFVTCRSAMSSNDLGMADPACSPTRRARSSPGPSSEPTIDHWLRTAAMSSRPPSTTNDSPVTYDASGEARKLMAAATSEAWAGRRSGIPGRSCAVGSSSC